MNDDGIAENKAKIDEAVTAIFSITNPKIAENRKPSIESFISSTINGDMVSHSLVISASLSQDRAGILVYFLTNVRLIKLEIDASENIKAFSYFLNSLSGVEQELIENGRIRFEFKFKNDSVGLRYANTATNISQFFQRVEKSAGNVNQ